MLNQTLILVDENDKFLGYAPREECHSGRGKRHRAFVTLLFDSQNKVILQKRKHKLFDGLWDLTAISHPLHVNGKDEDFQTASDRALKKEMRIGHVQIKEIGAFNYFSRDGKNCENEYCAVLVGDYDGDWKPNKDEVYEVKKLKVEEFLDDVENNPKRYAPWTRLAAKKILKQVQNDNLGLFKTELQNFLNIFETYSTNFFTQKAKETGRYSPLISKFYRDLDDYSQGAKRVRGFLVWMGYRIAGGRDVNKIFDIALAVEIIHSFLLIHDDIIDRSDLRRGKSSIHKRYEKDFGEHYGLSQAIVVGDIACFEAFKLVNKSHFEDKQKTEALEKLLNVFLETGYGEALDVLYSYNKPNFAQIWKMTQLKTARYTFVGPLLVGATFGKITQIQAKAMEEYGTSVGLAFQIHDDILGLFGDEKTIGKSVLSDMREGKNTLLIHKARERIKGLELGMLEKLWGNSRATENDLRKVREIVERCEALEWCRGENQKLIDKAKNRVSAFTKNKDLQLIFSQIADFVINRGK